MTSTLRVSLALAISEVQFYRDFFVVKVPNFHHEKLIGSLGCLLTASCNGYITG